MVRETANILKGLKPGIFCIDDMITVKGYHIPGTYWNGWECPYFTFEEATKILNAIYSKSDKYNPGSWSFNKERKVFITQALNEDEMEWGVVFCEINNKMVELYPIGSFAWIWTKDD